MLLQHTIVISESCMQTPTLLKLLQLFFSESCMQTPTDSSCTDEDIGGTDSLPDKVKDLWSLNNIDFWTPQLVVGVEKYLFRRRWWLEDNFEGLFWTNRKIWTKNKECHGSDSPQDMLLGLTNVSAWTIDFQFLYTTDGLVAIWKKCIVHS